MHNKPSTAFLLSLALLALFAAACSTQEPRTANKSTAALSDNDNGSSSDEPKLTLTATAGCTSIITLIDSHHTEVEALCSLDGLVAKDIARDDSGCGYGEVRSLTLACFAQSPDAPTPPAQP
jgi:hypothetical protein